MIVLNQNGTQRFKVSIRQMFRQSNVYTREKCRNCFAKYYCSGGCSANAYNFHGTIDEPYEIGCEMQRKRIECAIMIKAALAEARGEEVEENS